MSGSGTGVDLTGLGAWGPGVDWMGLRLDGTGLDRTEIGTGDLEWTGTTRKC